MMYKFGDWVIYDNGYKQEIGRVTMCTGRNAFVCFYFGCTASYTPFERLRPATHAEIGQAPDGIGFHRFDAICPEYDGGSVCSVCRQLAEEALR